MYKNRINRTAAAPTIRSHPQLFIRRSEIAFDLRAAYVDSVCRALIESRFGPGAFYEPSPAVINWSNRPNLEPVLVSDLLNDEPNSAMPFGAIQPQGRAGWQVADAALRRAKQIGLVAALLLCSRFTSVSPSNQGRGSP
jgi:hypothetical protein